MMQTDYGHLEQELKAGHPVATPTRGTSMQPLLYENRTVAVLMPLSGPLRRGDVALYKRENGMYVLHRVVCMRDGTYVIRGDNCYYQETIPPEQLLGVMTEVLRNGKTIHVTDFGYRCYVWLLLLTYPVRYVVHQPKRALWHLKHVLHLDGGRA